MDNRSSALRRRSDGAGHPAHLLDLYGMQVSPDLIAASPMRCWTRSGNGGAARWTGCIPS